MQIYKSSRQRRETLAQGPIKHGGARCEVKGEHAPLQVLAGEGADPVRAMRQATAGRATFCVSRSLWDQQSCNAPLLPCAPKSDHLLALPQLRNGGQVSRRGGDVRRACAQGLTCGLGRPGGPSWAQQGTESTPSPSPFDARSTYTPSPESQPQVSPDVGQCPGGSAARSALSDKQGILSLARVAHQRCRGHPYPKRPSRSV